MLVSSPAAGQQNCGKRSTIVERLESQYEEHRAAFALTASGWFMEIFATRDGKTWTLLVTNPAGRACITGSGSEWQLDQPKPEGEVL